MKRSRISDSDYGYGNSNSGFIGLVDRLASLEFRSFQQCVVLWLGAREFRHIRSLGRKFRRGRRSHSGADFVATPPGLLSRPVAVQIRHWKTPVQIRAIDELRGYMLRNNVPNGMIVTNSSFSRRAEQASTEFPGRPIHLVSLIHLAKSMTALRLGITDEYGGLVVDEPFFRNLNHLAFASSFLGQKNKSAYRSNRHKLKVDSISHVDDPGQPPRKARVLQLIAIALLLVLTVLYFIYFGSRP